MILAGCTIFLLHFSFTLHQKSNQRNWKVGWRFEFIFNRWEWYYLLCCQIMRADLCCQVFHCHQDKSLYSLKKRNRLTNSITCTNHSYLAISLILGIKKIQITFTYIHFLYSYIHLPFLKSCLSYMCVTSAYTFKEVLHIIMSFYSQPSAIIAKWHYCSWQHLIFLFLS